MKNELSIVVPLYNEEEVIGELKQRLTAVLDKCTQSFEVILVNDGSIDNTLSLARDICRDDPRFKLVSFSRNFGHQIAVTAGTNKSSGQAVIIIDADLQDPPEVIPEMIRKWRDGYQVVYGVRKKREGDSILKRSTAKIFYRLLKLLTPVQIPLDAGDFRLMDRRAVDQLNIMEEQSRFIRGMVSWIGFRQVEILYARDKRFAGKTKYPFRKMLAFAVDGIISFSNVPLRISSILGIITAGISFLFVFYGIISRIFFPQYTISGWASVFTAVLFIGGIQLISLGILGEYVSRIYKEIKKRPLYIIDEEINL